jgi:hypothetical protein
MKATTALWTDSGDDRVDGAAALIANGDRCANGREDSVLNINRQYRGIVLEIAPHTGNGGTIR